MVALDTSVSRKQDFVITSVEIPFRAWALSRTPAELSQCVGMTSALEPAPAIISQLL